MLTKVHIQNFRVCRDVSMENLGNVVALVGRNGAGKSSILQAIALGAMVAASDKEVDVRSIQPWGEYEKPAFRATLEFKSVQKQYRYDLTIGYSNIDKSFSPLVAEVLEELEGEKSRKIFERDQSRLLLENAQILIGETVPAMQAIRALFPASDSIVNRIVPVVKFLSGIRYYSLDETPFFAGLRISYDVPVPGEAYETWREAYEAGRVPGDSGLVSIIYMYRERKEEMFDVLVALLGPNGLGLIDEIRVTTIERSQRPTSPTTARDVLYLVEFVPSRGETDEPLVVTMHRLSTGTRRVLRMLISMIFDRSSVMLIEQPEDNLHQGLTQKLIDLMRENTDGQIILATHSSALLNMMKPEEIRLVSLQNGFTSVRGLNNREQEIAIEFMNDTGPLYDFIEPLQEA